jgi:hypothetical protein
MPLPSSGQIKLSQIRNEFSLGSGQIAMSQLRGRGNAPATGLVRIGGHFHGTSAVTYIHQSTVTTGSVAGNKSPLVYRGYTGGGGATNVGSAAFGSITTRTISGTGIQVNTVAMRDDNNSTAIPANDVYILQFTAAFTGWTYVIIGSTTLTRASATNVNGGRYEWNQGTMSASNIFGGNGSTRAVKIV